MASFKEYLDSKGKIPNTEVKVVADKVDMPKDREVKPPKFMGMVKDGKGYKQPQADGDSKKIKYGKSEGLGDLASDKDMHYDVTTDRKPAKIPTAESFIYVFPKVSELVASNPELVEHLVRDLKRNGLLSVLVAELATHNETFKHLAEIMSTEEYGQEFCSRLVRAINEDVAPPYGEEEKEEEDEDKPKDDAAEETEEEPEVPAKPEMKKPLAIENLQYALCFAR